MTRVFLSYSTADRDLANQLKGRLDHRLTFWRDQDRIDVGDALTPAIERAITEHDAVLLLLTPRSITSDWVQREVSFARSIGRKIIPVFHEIEPRDLPPPFDTDQAAVSLLPLETTRHRVLKALGLDPLGEPHELVLAFSDPALIDRQEGEAQITRVEATIHWQIHTGAFRSPLGFLEAEDARWYLERYHLWPADEFENRARRIEAELPRWGRLLWDAVLTALGPGAAKAFAAWLAASEHGRRSLSIQVEAPDPDRDPPSRSRGTAALLALPWELLRDREGWLFHHHRVSLRRLMPSGHPVHPSEAPIRVLAVVARPAKAGIIDPRVSATGLLEAVEPLGSAVEVDFLRPPTLPALVGALSENRYHVLHFDGHGVYDKHTGLGCLCFESPHPQRREAGEVDLVPGHKLQEALGGRPLPLVFLEACQSADEGKVAGSAVATALLAAGAGALIAMSHSVLVETARRFTTELYRHLCEGQTVGQAVTAARTALFLDHDRGKVTNGLPLRLHDWFVPVLLQRGEDQPLLSGGVHLHPLTERTKLERAFATHSLPPELPHHFVGRLPERLALERLCEVPFSPNHRTAHPQRIGLIIGVGGQGKTTLAVELGRWLHRTGLFPGGVAFVSLEGIMGMTAVLSALGRAVMNGFVVKGDGEAEHAEARELLKTHLRQRRTLLIFDNFESVLPPPPDAPQAEQWLHEPELLAALLDLAHDLAQVGESRVLITSREGIDDPRFCVGPDTRVVTLGGLSRWEAIELVGEICRREGIRPEAATEEDLGALVDAVSGHPRSMVLLPPLLKEQGVAGVTEKLHELMAELEAKYPGQREKSLFASLKLSLDRLPKWVREKLPPLGLLRVGVFNQTMRIVLNLEQRDFIPLVEALATSALLTPEGSYLRFHPALTLLLESELQTEHPMEVKPLWNRMVVAYWGQVGFLLETKDGRQRAQASELATQELPNLLRVLNHLVQGDEIWGIDAVIVFAAGLEQVLAFTSYQRALRGVATVRGKLASRRNAEGGLSQAQFLASCHAIDQLRRAGRIDQALAATEVLVEEAEAAGSEAYPGADYDLFVAHYYRGQAYRMAGQPETALAELETARRGFVALSHSRDATNMALKCLSEAGHCLQAVGRFEAATDCYQQAIVMYLERGNLRDAAADLGQLATIHLFQGRHAEAIQGWRIARATFTTLNEPGSVATAWHMEGMVHEAMRQLDAAEAAYQQALAIEQAQGSQFGAAKTMNQLACVAGLALRWEEAVAWSRRALDTFCAIRDHDHEASSRHNLASSLRHLDRLAEAEVEIRQAIALKEVLGLAAEPWKSWDLLQTIAQDGGDVTTSREAREMSLDWYRRYRAQGGHPQQPPIVRLFVLTTQALDAALDARTALLAKLTELGSTPGLPDGLPHLLAALVALLQGDPATARAILPDLHYMDAVELERLLTGTWP